MQNLISSMRAVNMMSTQPIFRHGSTADTWSSKSCLCIKASYLTFRFTSALSGKYNYTSIGTHTSLLTASPAFSLEQVFMLLPAHRECNAFWSAPWQVLWARLLLQVCTAWCKKALLMTGVPGKTKYDKQNNSHSKGSSLGQIAAALHHIRATTLPLKLCAEVKWIWNSHNLAFSTHFGFSSVAPAIVEILIPIIYLFREKILGACLCCHNPCCKNAVYRHDVGLLIP